MTKSNPRRRNRNRTDPTAKPAKLPSDPELLKLREQKILPVLKDLQSADQQLRSSAATAISNLIDDSRCRKLLLREQLVRILLEQSLTDSSLETRCAGWGILKNLAIEEEVDFCVHLYRQDILSAIERAVNSLAETINARYPTISTLPKAQQALLWNLSSSVIGLLSSLSDAQIDIVEVITRSPIINFLAMMLTVDSIPVDLQQDTLSCLTALVEGNRLLSQKLASNKSVMDRLMDIKDSKTSAAVLACGILHNMYMSLEWFDHNTPNKGASDAGLVPILTDILEHTQLSNETNGTSHSMPPDELLVLALDILATIAADLQEALEHASRNEKDFEGFADDDNDDKMEEADDLLDVEEGADEDHEMGAEDMQVDLQMVLDNEASGEGMPTDDSTLQRLVKGAAPHVLSLASRKKADVDEAIQSHALSGLNNIAWTISSIDFAASSGNDSLENFWSSFAQRVWTETVSPILASNKADIELASSTTSLAWALARSVKGAIKLREDEHRKFMALYQASKSLKDMVASPVQNGSPSSATEEPDAFQSLGVKSIGVLSQLALDPAPTSLNREIGVFLITILQNPDTPPADAVEALNQIFDVYADESFACDEAVFWADGFYKHLQEILPKMRKMAKGIDKRKLPELRARVDEVIMNLGGFLKYKKGERQGKDL